MAKITFHDFEAIHDALNDMIIAEVKAALGLLPYKSIVLDEKINRVVVSESAFFEPVNATVTKVWLEAPHDCLKISVRLADGTCSIFSEDDDMIDISQLKYLILEIAAKVDEDKSCNLQALSLLTCGYSTESSLRSAAERLITV